MRKSVNHVALGRNLYVADNPNNKICKIVIANGVITTVADSEAQDDVNGTGMKNAKNAQNARESAVD